MLTLRPWRVTAQTGSSDQLSFDLLSLFNTAAEKVQSSQMPHYLGQLPEKLGVQPARASWQGLNHYAPDRAQYRVDHGTITGRSWDNFGALEASIGL
jgi:hypothetical protein